MKKQKNLTNFYKDNYVYQYWQEISKGLIVSKKIFAVYKKLVEDMQNPQCEWVFDNEKANRAIFFIENYCKHSKGSVGGKPFILELWQKALVASTFGFIHRIDHTRRFLEVWLMVARKNGKSTLAAAIGIYMMIADNEAGAEVYAVATKRDQAKIIWLEAKRMTMKSETLLSKIKPLVAEMYAEFNESYFKPLGADSSTLDGLNVHCGLFDEVHAWTDKNLYDVVKDGTTSREQPLILITTTAGTVRNGIFDLKYEEIERIIKSFEDDVVLNDRILPIIYELDDRAEWTDETSWTKANPALGSVKSYQQLKEKVNAAKLNAMYVKNLLCKDFNIRDTTEESFLTFEQLLNTAVFDVKELLPKPVYAFCGADLAETTDLTAAVVLFQTTPNSPIYVLSMFWIPEDLLDKKVKEDKIPYDVWKQQGLLRTTPGNTLHPMFLTQWFREMRDEYDLYFSKVGYDAWGAKYWVDEMAAEFGVNTMDKVIQGKKTLSQPMKELAADLEAKRIIYNNNPIMKWCMSNVSIDMDKNGNIQPCKGKNPRMRIDGFAALLNAYVVYKNNIETYHADLSG